MMCACVQSEKEKADDLAQQMAKQAEQLVAERAEMAARNAALARENAQLMTRLEFLEEASAAVAAVPGACGHGGSEQELGLLHQALQRCALVKRLHAQFMQQQAPVQVMQQQASVQVMQQQAPAQVMQQQASVQVMQQVSAQVTQRQAPAQSTQQQASVEVMQQQGPAQVMQQQWHDDPAADTYAAWISGLEVRLRSARSIMAASETIKKTFTMCPCLSRTTLGQTKKIRTARGEKIACAVLNKPGQHGRRSCCPAMGHSLQ